MKCECGIEKSYTINNKCPICDNENLQNKLTERDLREIKNYGEIADRDFRRELYKQIDKEETDKNMEDINLKEYNKAWDEYDKDKEIKDLLQGFISYGMIDTITGVISPEGTHKELIDRARQFLYKNYK